MNRNGERLRIRRLSLALSLPFVAACGGDASTDRVPVQVSLQAMSAPAAFADACGNTVSSARLVLHEIELDRDIDDDLEADPGDNEDVEVGPFLIDLAGADFNGTIQEGILQANVPAGTYEEVEFDIAPLTDDPADLAAAEADPAGLGEMMDAGLSIRITGTGSSGDFTFESDLSEGQEHPVLVTIGDSPTGVDNILLRIDSSTWFISEADGSCLDPQDPADHDAIEESIEGSIDIDEDDDLDGTPDDEQDDEEA